MTHRDTVVGHTIPSRPWRSTALIWAARFADIWLHPLAFLRGNRRQPKTFDDMRALGLLADTRRKKPVRVEGDEQVSAVPEG